MILKRIADATAEPVSLAEIKSHLRLSTSTGAEDDLLNGFIKAAREQAENKMKRAVMQQTWKLVIDDFPSNDDYIELPKPPLSTISSAVTITYNDTAGASTTLGATAYTVDTDSEPGRVFLASTNEWPSCVSTARNSVQIQYITGATSATDVPESIKAWIKLRVASMYENRESLVVDKYIEAKELPRTFIDGLLDPYTVDVI